MSKSMVPQIGVQRMQAEGSTVKSVPYLPGADGIRGQSLPYILSCIREGRHDQILRGWANEKLRAVGNDGRDAASLDPILRAGILLDALRAQTSYAPDPIGTEWIQKPHVTLCLKDQCLPLGDCDDVLSALGAVLASIGINVFAVHQRFGGGAQEHILLGIEDNSGGRWYADPSTRDPVYQGSRAMSEDWISPLDTPSLATGTAGPEFVTLGAPYRGSLMIKRYPQRRINPGAQCGIGRVGDPGFGADIFTTGWETQEVADATDQIIGAYVSALDTGIQACASVSPADKTAWAGNVAAYNDIHKHLQTVEQASVVVWDPVGKLIEYKIVTDQLNSMLPALSAWAQTLDNACKGTAPHLPAQVPGGGVVESGGSNSGAGTSGSPVSGWTDIIKAVGYAALAVAGAYTVVKVVQVGSEYYSKKKR